MRFAIPVLLLFALQAPAKDDPVVFKSDVALTRVDAQVVDKDGRAITGLQRDDFVLRFNGRALPIRNFASENMPIDILLLLDVSGSMQPHVQRIASAAQHALDVLAPKDRVAIMIFDTSTRVRLPFRNSHDEITSELDDVLRSERFNGGTHITRALVDAANYVAREARPDARRAIVILTDDQTQDAQDEPRVEAALQHANAVLSFLQAPYEPPGMNRRGGRSRGTWGSGGGGGWPGGGGIGFPGGGPITLGRGHRGYGGADRSHSAGTADIARDSGGDTMQVDDASALEDTLTRLRQRYALYFYLPEGSVSSDQQTVQVDLSNDARLRFEQADIHYRRVYMASNTSGEHTGPVVTRAQQPGTATTVDSPPSLDEPAPKRRSVAVNDDSGSPVNTVGDDTGSSSGQAASPSKENQPSTPSSQPANQPSQSGGWPRAPQPNTPPQ